MRDRPHPNHKLEWPGGVVPEWAKPQQNANKRRGKGKGPGGGGVERQGGSSPSKRERLQKVMAQSGHGSRRNIEILIAQGHITINGQVAKLGDSVGPGDKVKLDGKLLGLRFGEPLPRVLLYHKTTGEIVTRDDPEKRPTVFDKLPKVNGGRWVSVGRLDFNTEGLLIFTTNGELANRLTHPRFEVEREYAVRIMGELTEEQKAQLLTGVEIDGESCKFDSIEDRGGEGSNHWYHVVLREGKNREVRRMMEAVSLMVSRLMRVRFGSVELPSHIKRGMMREMEEEQIQDLLQFAGMVEAPRDPGAEEESVEDEFDNIGNRITDANRDRRGAAEHHDTAADDLGNRVDTRENAVNRAADREPDGNRGTYGEGQRPPQPGQRRPHGAKPFAFGKKRGAGRGAQPQGQGGAQHHGQGQGHGQHRKHKGGGGQAMPVPRRVEIEEKGPLKAWIGGEGEVLLAQPRPQPQERHQRPHHQGERDGNKAPKGERDGNAAPKGPPGAAKPGRHRRNKNRNRARGGGGGSGDSRGNVAPAGNKEREPG
jgi:23S rRNA pseudouridine2605 synthase